MPVAVYFAKELYKREKWLEGEILYQEICGNFPIYYQDDVWMFERLEDDKFTFTSDDQHDRDFSLATIVAI